MNSYVRLLLTNGRFNTERSNLARHNAQMFCRSAIEGMYKRSEPMKTLHSVQKYMANVYLPLQFREVEMECFSYRSIKNSLFLPNKLINPLPNQQIFSISFNPINVIQASLKEAWFVFFNLKLQNPKFI